MTDAPLPNSPQNTELTPRLDLRALRARLAGRNGRDYWRSLDELAGSQEFGELLEREFPRHATHWDSTLDRRRFLQLMGASLALAGLTSCRQQPLERIVPYVKQPEEIVPGKPLYFASATTQDGFANGVLVESHMGRPTKIEGNPLHPASLGATDARTQATVLTLYDPDRSRVLLERGQIRTWDNLRAALDRAMRAQRGLRGAGLRILTGAVTSPTLAAQIDELERLLPEARWHQYTPGHADGALAGTRLAFRGQVHAVHHDLRRAEVIVTLDADLLGSGPGHVRYAREFAAWRRVRTGGGHGEQGRHAAHGGSNGHASGGNGLASGGNGLASAGNDALVAAGGESVAPIGRRDAAHMNRLYAIESMPTVTGTIADHRWALAASEIESLARDLALALRVPGVVGGRPGASNAHPWLRAVVDDLQKHPGRSLVVAGDTTSPEVHALVHAINVQLGNTGSTVHVTEPVEARPVLHHASLAELVGDMRAGNVDLLCIIGGNPVFDAPVDLDFAGALDQVGLRIHLGLYDDETAERCHWHVPAAHELESWSDARSHDGTASIVQPLIEPLYHGKSAHELLEALVEVARGEESTEPPLVPYDRLRDTWRRWHQARRAAADAGSATPGTAGAGNGSAGSTAIAADFDTFWRRALHDGLIPGTGSRPRQPRLDRDGVERAAQRIAERAATRRQRAAGTCELNLRLDPAVHDGSLANNGWMQELPRPWTRLTWDNAVLVSPAQASTLGVENGDVVQVTAGERAVQAPVWVLPGHAQGSVTLHLGYGRRRAGRVASGAGVDAYPLRTGDAPWLVDDVVLEPTGERRSLACTQDHNSMAGRDLIRSATIDTHRRDPHWAHAHAHEPAPDDSLYPNFDYDGYAWGMSIDLSACTGCNACVVACQAENNIPVVGKEQVLAAREMHWLRIDRYFQGDIDRPEIAQQPLLCQHCERAPCEPVCPVGATVHSSEGLNDMAYNRCVGTRYCSNNCPYKVRRFNFLQFTELRHTSVSLQRNPDVTVRTRGVMEKCTFCVQRINHARITAKTEGRRIQDGDIQTACQQVCPTQAILFGDQNDAGARVTAAKHDPLDYSLLGELNTRPRLTYLARLRNPNPALDGTHQETDRG